jgi:hypothetical protein
MSTENATANGQAPFPESLRERIARHIRGDAQESNWSLIVGDAARLAREEHRLCRDCDGLGFVALSEQRLATFALRVADMRGEAAKASAAGRLDRERQIGENIRGEHWNLNRESVCKTCRGSGYGASVPRRSVAHDAYFATVTCPACRGQDARNRLKDEKGDPKYPKLMDAHPGSSCGETFARNDSAADSDDRCRLCMGDAYVVPITVRPVAKGGPPEDYIEELESTPVYYRAADECDTEDPAVLFSEIEAEDPTLAAALAVLLGPRGDEWGQHHWGRRFAIWPLVDAGERLVEESSVVAECADWYDRKLEILKLERVAVVQAERGDPRRRALLAMADRQARALESRVERAIKAAEAA